MLIDGSYHVVPRSNKIVFKKRSNLEYFDETIFNRYIY